MPIHTDPRRILILLVGGLVLLVGVATGAEPPSAPMLQQSLPRFFRVSVVSGRFQVNVVGRTNTTQTRGSGDDTERLEIRSAFGAPSLTYGRKDEKEKVYVHLAVPSSVTIRRMPVGDAKIVPVELTHLEGDPLVLKVGPEDDRRTYKAPSLWHLFLLHEDVTKQRLLPLLGLIRPDHDWAAQLGEIKTALFRLAEIDRPGDYARWTELVEQLGNDRFHEREEAERRLRECGRAVFPFLVQLGRSRLDAEQNFRIERILRSMASQSADDTPDQIASWLASDARIWFTLLDEEDAASRKLAARQLSKVLGEPIGFDPEADQLTRAGQLDRLRRRVFRD